jgi:hypothetical protein
MADKVTYSSMIGEPRDNVVALLTSTNVPDPTLGASSSEFRKWIYSRRPDVKATDFKGYPVLVVYPCDTITEKGGSKDGKKKFMSFSVEIEVITSDRGYGANNAKGLVHMDTISDNILKTFMNITNRKTLIANGLPFANVDPSKVIPDEISNEQVYTRSFFLNFRGWMAVSA